MADRTRAFPRSVRRIIVSQRKRNVEYDFEPTFGDDLSPKKRRLDSEGSEDNHAAATSATISPHTTDTTSNVTAVGVTLSVTATFSLNVQSSQHHDVLAHADAPSAPSPTSQESDATVRCRWGTCQHRFISVFDDKHLKSHLEGMHQIRTKHYPAAKWPALDCCWEGCTLVKLPYKQMAAHFVKHVKGTVDMGGIGEEVKGAARQKGAKGVAKQAVMAAAVRDDPNTASKQDADVAAPKRARGTKRKRASDTEVSQPTRKSTREVKQVVRR